MKLKTFIKRVFIFVIMITSIYAIGRLYFYFTDGFTRANITSDFTYQPAWQVRDLVPEEQIELALALDQSYHYLGKGCQSYVFLSHDKEFVIKFFKYQRFRLQPWINYFSFLPTVKAYEEEKKAKKWQKLNFFISSWKVAFENLKDETGLVYVHLNKSENLNKRLIIYDKLGLTHQLNLDEMEFCVQRRADMLCEVLLNYKNENELQRGKILIDRLFALILSEYARGLADNDHALMQNTGVVGDMPIHIDVGQFVINDEIKDPQKYHQELFTKTFKFRKWLAQYYPELNDYVEMRLQEIIGPTFYTMKPIWWNRPERNL